MVSIFPVDWAGLGSKGNVLRRSLQQAKNTLARQAADTLHPFKTFFSRVFKAVCSGVFSHARTISGHAIFRSCSLHGFPGVAEEKTRLLHVPQVEMWHLRLGLSSDRGLLARMPSPALRHAWERKLHHRSAPPVPPAPQTRDLSARGDPAGPFDVPMAKTHRMVWEGIRSSSAIHSPSDRCGRSPYSVLFIRFMDWAFACASTTIRPPR